MNDNDDGDEDEGADSEGADGVDADANDNLVEIKSPAGAKHMCSICGDR